MTTSSKDAEGEVVSSDGKIKADLTAHRGLNHQTTKTIETELPSSGKCKGWKPKPNSELMNPGKIKGFEWQ